MMHLARPPEPPFNPNKCHTFDRELLIQELVALSHAKYWEEAKLGWEIGTVARAEDVVEREDGTTYGFLSSEKFDKWRYGCAPGAQTNLADGGLQHASVYIKTTFRCSSMGFSTGSLLFTSRGECKSEGCKIGS